MTRVSSDRDMADAPETLRSAARVARVVVGRVKPVVSVAGAVASMADADDVSRGGP
jgi:ApbE superfamily uncharacterized protein (UPF0280 family)